MGLFFRTKKGAERRLEMLLGYDGRNWVLSGEGTSITAPELSELDRLLEIALSEQWQQEPLEVHMRTDNSMIPEWIRPYMNHYFNRILELPLQY